jgi:hypothetical protein
MFLSIRLDLWYIDIGSFIVHASIQDNAFIHDNIPYICFIIGFLYWTISFSYFLSSFYSCQGDVVLMEFQW